MHDTNLDWQPVLLVKVTREPFKSTFCGLQGSHLHLALYPDSVIYAAWDMPSEESVYAYTILQASKNQDDFGQ